MVYCLAPRLTSPLRLAVQKPLPEAGHGADYLCLGVEVTGLTPPGRCLILAKAMNRIAAMLLGIVTLGLV